MTVFVITAAKSKIVAGGSAFASTTKNSTLTLDPQAYLISMSGGAGADIGDFTNVTVDGVLAGYGSNSFGLEATLATTTNALALSVGAAGEIYGGGEGVYSVQADAISNAGIIEGDEINAIDEENANAGANSLINSTTGEVIGFQNGYYANGDNKNVTENIKNSGLIEGQFNTGVYLVDDAKATIANAAGGRIVGETGIFDEESSKTQTILNSGYIDGYQSEGVYLAEAAGAATITNDATGQITGQTGIEDFNSSGPLAVDNYGLINGVDDCGIFVIESSSSAATTVSNASTGQITAYEDGLYFDQIKGAVSVSNAGLIWGQSDYGADVYDAAGLKFTNLATGIVKGQYYGIVVDDVSGVAAIQNMGQIDGGGEYGVEIEQVSGATTINNASTGRIVGSFGIYDENSSGAFTLVNSALITGEEEDGVYVNDDSSSTTAIISNAGNARITAADNGVYFYNYTGAVSFTNAGLIWGGNNDGVEIDGAGAVAVNNKSTGIVKGEYYGLYDYESRGSDISNAGLIAGIYEDGVYINTESGNLTLTNAATGTLTAENGIYDNSFTTSTRKISNAGAIVGTEEVGIGEYSAGTFTLTNSATGRITGIEQGVYDDAGGIGARTIDNSGLIQAGNGTAVYEATAGTNAISNVLGGQIFGGGSSGYGIYDGASTGTQTIVNAGTLTGGEYALFTQNSTTVAFTNSGVVNGNVELEGDDTVTITGGTVNGNIDMSESATKDTFTASGGVINGQVLFGSASGNTATIDADVAAIDFLLHYNVTNTFVYEAANASTATRLDKISNWQSTGDTIDLSAFASKLSVADIAQNLTTSMGDDIITLTGTKFSLELVGVTSDIASSQFKF